MSHERFVMSLHFRILKMASVEQFAITPYCFEPKYSSKEESSNSIDGNESSNSEEECIRHLDTLQWCKCENCSTTKLNHLGECLCCRETPEASAFTNSMKCIIQLWLPKCVNIQCRIYAFDNFHILTIKFKYT